MCSKWDFWTNWDSSWRQALNWASWSFFNESHSLFCLTRNSKHFLTRSLPSLDKNRRFSDLNTIRGSICLILISFKYSDGAEIHLTRINECQTSNAQIMWKNNMANSTQHCSSWSLGRFRWASILSEVVRNSTFRNLSPHSSKYFTSWTFAFNVGHPIPKVFTDFTQYASFNSLKNDTVIVTDTQETSLRYCTGTFSLIWSLGK